jgi:hypothetical protein
MQKFELGACAVAKGCVACGKLIGEQTKRPSVADNVMQDDEHYVVLGPESQQNQANQRPFCQTEGLVHLPARDGVGLMRQI